MTTRSSQIKQCFFLVFCTKVGWVVQKGVGQGTGVTAASRGLEVSGDTVRL